MERKVCTIGEWLDVWYEVYAVPEYASKTLEIYRDARKRLSRGFPEIESMLLTELLPVTFQKALSSSSATPTRPLRSAGTSPGSHIPLRANVPSFKHTAVNRQHCRFLRLTKLQNRFILKIQRVLPMNG